MKSLPQLEVEVPIKHIPEGQVKVIRREMKKPL